MLLPFLCLRYIQSPTASGHYQEVWPCGQSAGRRRLITVSHAHHFKTSASWPPNPHSVFPRARWGETHHAHCTDGKTEAGRGQWLAQDHTESCPFPAPDPPQPPAEPCPDSNSSGDHQAQCSMRCTQHLPFYAGCLMGLFFFSLQKECATWNKLKKTEGCKEKFNYLASTFPQIPPGHAENQH